MMTMMVPRRRENFDLFDSFFDRDFFAPAGNTLMKTDIVEKKDKYVIEMDLPGFDKNNINVDLEDGYLKVSAKIERRQDDGQADKFLRRERFYGSCSRSFYVGENITRDDIKAKFADGILAVSVPKKEEKPELPENKHIAIE